MADEKNNDDELLSIENVDALDIYSLTSEIQRKANNELVNVNQAKSTDQVMSDVAYAIKAKHQLEISNYDEIGVALIVNRANIQKTARQFKLDPTELRMLIRTEPILHGYWRAAYHEIKALTDDRVIELLEQGGEENKDILKMVYNKFYSGRKNGGYNPNELGAIGYKDPAAIEQQEEIKKDLEQEDNKYTVIIEFAEKAVTLNDEESVEGQLLESIDVDELDEGGDD